MKLRENYLTVVSGQKGVGKSYQTFFKSILPYAYGDRTGEPRNVIIFDVQNEYGVQTTIAPEDIEKYGKTKFIIETIDVKDIPTFCAHPTKGIRRIVMFHTETKYDKKGNIISRKGDPLTPDQMIGLASEVIRSFRGGMLLFEDISKLFGNHMPREFESMITSNRHYNTDVVLHVQSVGVLLPRLWQNVAFTRFHKQIDGVLKSKTKLSEFFMLYAVAEIIVDNRWFEKNDKRFFVWIDNTNVKIIGNFEPEEAEAALAEFVRLYPHEAGRKERHMRTLFETNNESED
jgi:hypothetical protein